MNQFILRNFQLGKFLLALFPMMLGNLSVNGSEKKEIPPFDNAHSQWNKVLEKFVVIEGPTSQVAYKKLKVDSKELGIYLSELETVTLEKFLSFGKKEQLAFLINAYNAFTIKLVLDHYPVKSIKDIGGFFSGPWKENFFTLLGQKRNLDDIEHGMIRQDPKAKMKLESSLRKSLPNFNDPRIHFVLNCASKSCPALGKRAYVSTRLEDQLEEATKTFLKDPKNNFYDAKAGILYLSSLFKWYKADFEKSAGSVQAFVSSRMARNTKEESSMKKAKVNDLDYDWSLNGN